MTFFSNVIKECAMKRGFSPVLLEKKIIFNKYFSNITFMKPYKYKG